MSENRPLFLSSCFEDPKGTRLRIRDRLQDMTGGRTASAERPLWMAEDFHELDKGSALAAFEKCEFCLEGVRQAECFVAVITHRYGSSVTLDGIGTVPSSFFEAELFEAALLGKPSFIFFLKGYEPEGKLANLIKLLAPSFPHMKLQSRSEAEILRKVERLLKQYQRPATLRRVPALPKFRRVVDTLIAQRHRAYDPRSAPPPFRFLGGSRFDPEIRKTDPGIIESVLERAGTAESHQVRLTLTWFALRALMAAPFDRPAYAEFVPLWQRAFGIWSRSSAWYGLHGYCVMGHLACLGTLAEIGRQTANRDDPSQGIPHGALASEYYSIAKITSQRTAFLDLALTHIQVGIDFNRGDTTNQLAIRASIFLMMNRIPEALKDYQRVAENRRERGGQGYGEGLSEWGYALLKTGKKSLGIEKMEAGVELLKSLPPSGFQVRALRKLAEGYALCRKFQAARDCAAQTREVAAKIGAQDQVASLEQFEKKLGDSLKRGQHGKDTQMSDEKGRSGLQFYWCEMKPGEKAMTWWGQLAGGMHRLITVREDLEALRSQRNVEKMLRRLESHVESFVIRAYELRERALGLLAARTNQPKVVQKLKHPKQREDGLSALKLIDSELTTAVGSLLPLLDGDIGLRNLHTHQFYLNLGQVTGSDIFDPYDALLDLSGDARSRRKLEAVLRREIKKMAQHYADKAEALLKAVEIVLEAAEPRPERSRRLRKSAGATRRHD